MWDLRVAHGRIAVADHVNVDDVRAQAVSIPERIRGTWY
jgi:hypothetical protein